MKTACILYFWIFILISCQIENKDKPIELPDQAVSIFDLTEDIQFLRLGDTSNQQSLFSKVQNAYLLDSFLVFGQNGMSYSDHGHYVYFDYNGNYLHRFNANKVVKDGMLFSNGFYADEEAIYIPDEIRKMIFKINHKGKLVKYFNIINKATLYLPLTDEITLYSYNLNKPTGLLDDHEYYDFFLYSAKSGKIIDKGVSEVPEWARMNYGDIQLLKSPHSNSLYHCTVRDPNYIIYEMTPERIQEIDRLTFLNAMIEEDKLVFRSKKMVDGHYFRDENVVTDVYAIQRVGDEIFCMIDRGFGTNYLVRKNIKSGESGAVQIDWHGMVARDYVLRAKVLAYTKDNYLVLFSPATTFKPFLDRNWDMLQPNLKNDFTKFTYSDNDVLIFLKFKEEFYDM